MAENLLQAVMATPLGVVGILNKDIPVPAGWRKLKMCEGR